MTVEHYSSDKAYKVAALAGEEAKECIKALVKQRDEMIAHLVYAHGSLNSVRMMGLPTIAGEESLEGVARSVAREEARIDSHLNRIAQVIPATQTPPGALVERQASFAEAADQKETSEAVMRAIAALAEDDAEAERIWQSPSSEERKLIGDALPRGQYRWAGEPFFAPGKEKVA